MSIVDKGKGPTVDSGLCRCCGSVKRCRILNVEYTWQGRKEIYSNIFEDCFGLVLYNLDGEAEEKLICATCVSRLRDANLFRHQVLQCEEKLTATLIQEETNKDIKQEKNYIKHEVELTVEAVDEEAVSENEYHEPTEHIQLESTFCIIKPEVVDAEADSPGYNTRDFQEEDDEEDNLTLNNFKKSCTNETDNKKVKEAPVKAGTPKRIQNILKKIIESNKTQNSKDTKKVKKVYAKRRTYGIEDGSFLNAISVVENSYVCPFNALNNSFLCIYCKEKFFDPTGLREHTMGHDSSKYKDILAHFRYTNKCLIDMQRIDCRLCDQKINDFSTFQTHITQVHGKKLFVDTSENEFFTLKFHLTNSNLNCTECNKEYMYFYDLRLHMAEHFGKNVCNLCGMHFFTDRNLKNHLTRKHKPVEENYTCSHCGKMFKWKHSLTLHIARLHNDEAVYLCYECDDSFTSLTLRRRHMAVVHNKGVSFKCKSCDKVFDSKKLWHSHNRRTHLRDYKHTCGVCDKKFFTSTDLRGHMTSHTGERKFHCEHCGKNYPRLKALKVHMQSHRKQWRT